MQGAVKAIWRGIGGSQNTDFLEQVQCQISLYWSVMDVLHVVGRESHPHV